VHNNPKALHDEHGRGPPSTWTPIPGGACLGSIMARQAPRLFGARQKVREKQADTLPQCMSLKVAHHDMRS
jgi:hypothetical protein